jgi:hypothetical protein
MSAPEKSPSNQHRTVIQEDIPQSIVSDEKDGNSIEKPVLLKYDKVPW